MESPGSPAGERPTATARVLAALERRAEEVGRAMAGSACERVPAIARVGSYDDAFSARLNRLCAEHVLAFVGSARASSRRAGALCVEDEHQGGTLTQTFAAYIDCDLNVVRTAKVLGLHANTVRHRLAKVEGLTGLDTRRVPNVIELAASVGLSRLHAGEG